MPAASCFENLTAWDTLSVMVEVDDPSLLAHDAWVEVDGEALSANARALREHIGDKPKIIAVVKAGGYGHGAAGAARAFLRGGADCLAVTTPAEALELRAEGIDADILVFAPPVRGQETLFVENNLIATLCDAAAMSLLATAARRLGSPARVHLKIDTGMGRFGASPDAAPELARKAADLPDIVSLEGVYTHFASALDPDLRYMEAQFNLFQRAIENIAAAGIEPGLRHCANSAAILIDEKFWLDAVRPGTLLYGQYPARHLPRKLALLDGWELKARVLSVRELPAGAKLGYGSEFTTKRPSKIAVLAVGLADGIGVAPVSFFTGKRGLATFAESLIGRRPPNHITLRGVKAPIVGRIAMQTCLADVTDIPEAAAGDIAVVPARRVTASARLPRVYRRPPEIG